MGIHTSRTSWQDWLAVLARVVAITVLSTAGLVLGITLVVLLARL